MNLSALLVMWFEIPEATNAKAYKAFQSVRREPQKQVDTETSG